MKKKVIIIVAIIVALAVAGGAVFFFVIAPAKKAKAYDEAVELWENNDHLSVFNVHYRLFNSCKFSHNFNLQIQ